ncbi:hypothetical protein [uncultured Erythrobacter sp.]|uniref:hypothetical protein n=1 Tax=uncultured Erythrobacter sp. TaxID=263913 RepID=UPI0026354FBB|nr:hypothetical protein [uncultured Erythrobacter sp.]
MSGFGRKGLAGAPTRQTGMADVSRGSIRFDVTPHPWKMLFAAFACIGAAIVMMALAVEGRGLILVIVPLGPTGAQIFYLLMALVCLVGLAHTVRGFLRSFGARMWMTLDQHAITGPTQYGGTRMIRIAYNAIQDIDLSSYGENQFAVIKAHDGGKIKVGSANFREASKWPAFMQGLDRRLNSLPE